MAKKGSEMGDESKLPGPVIFDVIPVSCSLTLPHSVESPTQLPESLWMALRLAPDETFRTPDNRSLDQAEWGITFYAGGSSNEFTELHNAIGMINYCPEWHSSGPDMDGAPESCFAWVNLRPSSFATLRDLAVGGKLPHSIRLHAKGMEFGWEPDGSAKVWDTTSYRNAPITRIEINSTLVGRNEQVDNNEGVAISQMSPPKRKSASLVLREASTAIAITNRRLAWVIALLAVTLAITLFR